MKTNKKKPEEVANIIEHFLDGTGGAWDWDDFISSPIHDDVLDRYRLKCNAVSEDYPTEKPGQFCNEDGVKAMRNMIVELRAMKISN